VIDNATQEVAKFKDYLPKAPTWQVLITSRQELGFAKKVALGFLSPSAAMELFYEHYQLDKNDELVQSILSTIDYHTLTIELLAKAMQKRRVQPIAKIISLLEDKGLAIGRKIGLEVGHSKGEKIERLFPYLQAIFELGEMTAKEIYLLKQFIGLPATFIALSDLMDLLGIQEENEAQWDDTIDALDSLKEKGWLIYEEQIRAGVSEPFYKMHRVIQDVLHINLKPTYEEVLNLIKNITEKLSIDQTKDNPIDKFPYILYGKRLLEIIPSSQSIDFSKFQNNLALVLQALGDYSGAKALLEKAIQSAEQNFGLDHPTTAVRYSNLALVLQTLGDYSGAKVLLEKAMQSDEHNFGPDHPTMAVSYSNLALVLQDLGDYSGAKVLLEKAMKSNEHNFGPDHPTTAVRYSNLASVLQDLGDYSGAKVLLEKAMKSNEYNFGPDHPNTVVSYSNLALVLQDLGDYSGAKVLLEKAMQSDEHNFGPDHPNMAVSYSNLATVLQDLGNYSGAKALLEKAIKSNEHNFGPDHPTTVVSYSNLAMVLKALGDYSGAKALLEKAMKWAEDNLGPDHPTAAVRYSNLASVLKSLGDYSGAKALFEKAYSIFETNLGANHPNTKVVEKWLDSMK